MIRLKAGTQYIIIVVIFLFSVYIGLKSSHILDKTNVKTIDTKYSEKIFSESSNYEKIRTIYKTDNLKSKLKEISITLDKEDVEVIYSINKNNGFIGIYEISTKNRSVISELRSIEGLDSESIEKNSSFDEAIDIKGNMDNYLISKKSIQDQLLSNVLSVTSKSSLRKDLSIIQSKIDSLLYLPKQIEKSKNSKLLYVYVSQNSGVNSINSSKIIRFVKITFAIMLIQIFGLIILYYLMVLITFLMKKMGVKTAKSSSSNYNYNNYYSRGKKKVKRIYKEEEKEDLKKK